MPIRILEELKKSPEERTGFTDPTEFEREAARFNRIEGTLRSHAERIFVERNTTETSPKGRV